MSLAEELTEGSFLRVQLLILCMTMGFLYGDLIEDYVYGGLNKLGGVWHNWDFFMPPYTCVLLTYTIGHFVYGHDVHGAWRHPEMSLKDSIYSTGQFPLSWPCVNYTDQERGRFAMVLTAHLIWGCAVVYY